jgi:RecA/RadA recombinase
MARKKANAEDNVSDIDKEYSLLAKETGGDTLDKLDSVKFFIDTGNLAINRSCSGRYANGGLPGGRIIEGFGPEASGKSLIGSNSLYGC